MKKEKYTPCHVANFILDKAEHEKVNVTPLKLHKLVYLIYGWVRAVLDRRLFDESIQAWEFGPVIPSLYHEFKRFGNAPITEKSVGIKENGELFIPCITNDDEVMAVMQKAWDVYKPFTAAALVNKTHEPDSPWAKSKLKEDILDENIKAYFTQKINEYIDHASK